MIFISYFRPRHEHVQKATNLQATWYGYFVFDHYLIIYKYNTYDVHCIYFNGFKCASDVSLCVNGSVKHNDDLSRIQNILMLDISKVSTVRRGLDHGFFHVHV